MCDRRLQECNVILDRALKINVYKMTNALRYLFAYIHLSFVDLPTTHPEL